MFLTNCFGWMSHNDVSLYFSFNKLMNCHWFRWFFLMNVLLYDDNCTTRLCDYVHYTCAFHVHHFYSIKSFFFCLFAFKYSFILCCFHVFLYYFDVLTLFSGIFSIFEFCSTTTTMVNGSFCLFGNFYRFFFV